MSGHSKWANIKHKKAKADAARGVNFAKFSREIIIAAKIGGPDINGNFRLRTAVEKAKAGGLPNDTIKRAIDKGAGNSQGDNFEEITYEGYAAGGVAVFIEAATDNRNRTAGDIRSYFTKFGGNLGETGCVGWIFEPCGLIAIVAGNLMQGTSNAALAAYQNITGNITNNADIILEDKVRNIETVCKMLDTQADIVRQTLKSDMESDSKLVDELS